MPASAGANRVHSLTALPAASETRKLVFVRGCECVRVCVCECAVGADNRADRSAEENERPKRSRRSKATLCVANRSWSWRWRWRWNWSWRCRWRMRNAKQFQFVLQTRFERLQVACVARNCCQREKPELTRIQREWEKKYINKVKQATKANKITWQFVVVLVCSVRWINKEKEEREKEKKKQQNKTCVHFFVNSQSGAEQRWIYY